MTCWPFRILHYQFQNEMKTPNYIQLREFNPGYIVRKLRMVCHLDKFVLQSADTSFFIFISLPLAIFLQSTF